MEPRSYEKNGWTYTRGSGIGKGCMQTHFSSFFSFRIHKSQLGFLKTFTYEVWMASWVWLGQPHTPETRKGIPSW